MTHHQRRIILLGPQPEYKTLRIALERINSDRPVALVTAGWQEDEADDSDVRNAIHGDVVNLKLFERSEQLFAGDQELIARLQDRQDELRHLRDAYRIRLDNILLAAREMLNRNDRLIDLESERESSIEMVRMLDRQYFVRTSQICDKYEQELQVAKRPLVIQHRNEIQKVLEHAGVIVISGGHAGIILNRLRIFGILEINPELPIVAWSGGSMALAEQVVFFHDSPPQGPGNAELMRGGMSLIDDILPLPDARTRMRMEDTTRVSLFARRFQQFRCVVFDEQTVFDRVDGTWSMTGEVEQLGQNGFLMAVTA